ncbi:hypothetical protein [Klebsiella grimontii]|uniref:hypothetical protein n=1 Tax=Klebsiella grimontii TaxID=2058152 RepID=UPI001D4BB8F4|nr:hypothetical protein [Klebsiella grimontii]
MKCNGLPPTGFLSFWQSWAALAHNVRASLLAIAATITADGGRFFKLSESPRITINSSSHNLLAMYGIIMEQSEIHCG